MLRWKMVMGRWHLTHEDVSVCRLVQQMAIQANSKVCPACLDTLADERLQWQTLNLGLMMKPDSQSQPEPFIDVKDAVEISQAIQSQFIIGAQE